MTDLCSNNPVGVLLALAERLHAHLDATARTVGITHAQARLLMHLDQPTRLVDLASQKDCDPSSITSLVQRLERDGLVEREVDPADARARRIRITAEGARRRAEFAELAGDGMAVLRELTAEQRQLLLAMTTASAHAPAPA